MDGDKNVSLGVPANNQLSDFANLPLNVSKTVDRLGIAHDISFLAAERLVSGRRLPGAQMSGREAGGSTWVGADGGNHHARIWGKILLPARQVPCQIGMKPTKRCFE